MEKKVVEISSVELCRRTGISYRQLNFWIDSALISPLGTPNPGSGRQRKFDEALVDQIQLLGDIRKTFGMIQTKILKQVLDNYEEGFVDLDEHITLSWRV